MLSPRLLLPFLSAAALYAAEITWTFDNLKSIGGHTLTILGAPKVIDTPKGKAIQFNGVNDAIFFDVHPLAGARTFTWEVIFRPDSDGPPAQRFFHMQETGSDHRLLFETRIIDKQWALDSFAHTSTGFHALMDLKQLHPADRWYHVAAVYDGKEYRNYVNGKLQNAAVINLSPQGPGRTSVGVRINKVDYFKGAIRVSRTSTRALTPAEFLPLP
ncbi:MAG TPA: LamG domain-containing protein [Bryobacteraceae bacterium]|nr:LamG domain-containing protein [Bryobacteraceae bacterium]